MRLSAMTLAGWMLVGGVAAAQEHDHAGAHRGPALQAAAAPRNAALPPDGDQAKAALDASPRHHEYVDVKVAGRAAPIKTWVVYPERKEKTGVVIVIHENQGLTEWIRAVADQLARDGFIAVAPDMLSGKGPNGGNTDSIPSREEVAKAFQTVTADEVVAGLNAVREYARALPASNGKVGSMGFCWGGARSFLYATAQPALNAAVVYYGTSPDAAALANVKAPVLGLYGGNDARVNATIEPAAAELKKAGKAFETHIYDGAGHGFLRQQSGMDGANLKAAEQAWPATLAFFRKNL